MLIPVIDDMIRAATTSAVHLEMRDGYTREDPAFVAWQQGFRHDPGDRASWWRPWLDLVAEVTGRGVVMRRARVVSEPLSDYVQFEHDITFTNVAAGEQVRWLPRRQGTDLCLPGNDCWLLDGTLLVVLHHAGSGDFLDAERVDDASTVEMYRRAFEAVWSRAVPHADYRPASSTPRVAD